MDQKQPSETENPMVEPEVITVDDACERYRGEWILMRVTGHNAKQLPGEGNVLAHEKSRDVIQEQIMAMLSAIKESGAEHYLFFGEERFYTGEEWRRWKESRTRKGHNRA